MTIIIGIGIDDLIIEENVVLDRFWSQEKSAGKLAKAELETGQHNRPVISWMGKHQHMVVINRRASHI